MWYVRFRVGKKRFNPSLSDDYQTACRMADIVIAEKRGIKKGAAVIGWHAFKGKYLGWKTPTHAAGTITRDETSFKMLESYFTISNLSDIKPELMDDFQSKLKQDGKSNVLTNRTIRSIKAALRKAEEWGLISPQAWRRNKMLKEPSGKLRFFSVAECQTIRDCLKGRWKTIALLGIRAGLRRGEMHALRWEMIDFEHNTIRIEAFADWAPKDWESRSIPMSKDLRAHLKSIALPDGFVLGPARIDLGSMTTYFRRLLKKAKLPKTSLHTLRHTFGAHLAIAGVSAPKIKALMGHAELKTTQIYMHLSPESIRDSIDKLPVF